MRGLVMAFFAFHRTGPAGRDDARLRSTKTTAKTTVKTV